MIFAQFQQWKKDYIREFLDQISEMASEEKILVAYNPVLCIALICESLVRISKGVSIYKIEAEGKKDTLLMLGNIMIEKYSDPQIETVFLDVDFKDRNLLFITSKYEFDPLFASNKVEILLEMLWEGKKMQQCDGTT